MADLFSFFGRFHPLLVHLPIGFLCFAVLLQLISIWKKDELLLKTVKLLWLLTAVSAMASVASGLLLSDAGGYDDEILANHKTGGIVLTILAAIIFLLHFAPTTSRTIGNLRTALVFVSFGLLIYTGHGGGSLTHGSDYLAASAEENENVTTTSRITTLDSADIFKDAVMPIFQSKCVSCHNPEKKKGELLLTSYEEIIKGGKTRAGIIPGNTASSEIYRRITLPRDHKEFMPSNGKKPLSETQAAILEWWIETGAHQKMPISKLNPDKKVADLFNDFFQMNQDAILSYKPEPAGADDIAALIKAGYQVNSISKSTNLLEVKYNGNGQSKPDLALLAPVKKQLVWLHLTNCQLTDEDVSPILALENLYKLNLNRNVLTDKGVSQLVTLSRLEYLNLYGNKISDGSLASLEQLKQLKKLYVWETGVDSTGAVDLMQKNKALEVVYKLQ